VTKALYSAYDNSKTGTILEFLKATKYVAMKIQLFLFFLFTNLLLLSSCGVVETVFKAGMWWAFFLVGLAVILVIILISKTRK